MDVEPGPGRVDLGTRADRSSANGDGPPGRVPGRRARRWRRWLAVGVVLAVAALYGQALIGYARARGQRYLDTVLLFEAMGGRWQDWLEHHADRRS